MVRIVSYRGSGSDGLIFEAEDEVGALDIHVAAQLWDALFGEWSRIAIECVRVTRQSTDPFAARSNRSEMAALMCA